MRDLKFHNPWLDLVVEMATEDPSVFVCPSGDYESGSVEDVYKHCVSSQCKERLYYADLKEKFGDLQGQPGGDANADAVIEEPEHTAVDITRVSSLLEEEFTLAAIERSAELVSKLPTLSLFFFHSADGLFLSTT